MVALDFLARLSEFDVSYAPESGIDPLGHYPIAESLGLRPVPEGCERQSRPRFLTAIAASFAVSMSSKMKLIPSNRHLVGVTIVFKLSATHEGQCNHLPIGIIGQDRIITSEHHGKRISKGLHLLTVGHTPPTQQVKRADEITKDEVFPSSAQGVAG